MSIESAGADRTVIIPTTVVPSSHNADLRRWGGVTQDQVATARIVCSFDCVEDGAALRLCRDMLDRNGNPIGSRTDWICRYPTSQEASLRRELLDAALGGPAVIAAAVRVLGARWLEELADELAATELVRRRAADAAALAHAEVQEALAREISVYFRQGKNKGFVLQLKRGNASEPFWRITFSEAWERDRFWDWLKWQTDRYEEFSAYLRTGTDVDLKSMLLREMLQTEQTARKAHLTTGGRRPLRFWCGETA